MLTVFGTPLNISSKPSFTRQPKVMSRWEAVRINIVSIFRDYWWIAVFWVKLQVLNAPELTKMNSPFTENCIGHRVHSGLWDRPDQTPRTSFPAVLGRLPVFASSSCSILMRTGHPSPCRAMLPSWWPACPGIPSLWNLGATWYSSESINSPFQEGSGTRRRH